jgi:hypothetical protein
MPSAIGQAVIVAREGGDLAARIATRSNRRPMR